MNACELLTTSQRHATQAGEANQQLSDDLALERCIRVDQARCLGHACVGVLILVSSQLLPDRVRHPLTVLRTNLILRTVVSKLVPDASVCGEIELSMVDHNMTVSFILIG